MNSRSFCLEDLQLGAKKQPTRSDKSPITPQVYNSFQNKQEKEFLQLYIKARSQSRDSNGKSSSRSHSSSNSPRVHVNDENRYNVASEPHSPNVEGNTLKRKTILRNLDNYDLKPFTSEKPSQFKRNHEAEATVKNQQTDAQNCSIKLEHDHNNGSFHYLESRDTVDQIQGPTSMEVLLPATKDLEIQVRPYPENTIEEDIQENEPEQQVQQGPENELQSHHNDNHRAIEIESSPPAITTVTIASSPIVFGSHVERAFKQIFALYAIWFLSYAILLGLNFGVFPYYVAFVFAWGVEGYLFYNNFKTMRADQEDSDARRRKLNYNFYILSLALIQALAVLKFEGLQFPLTLGVIPAVLATLFTCYLNNSRNTRKSNSIITFVQTLITLQLITVCIKIDGYLFWSWAGVFWIGWASLIVIGFYAFSLTIMFLYYLCFEESSTTKSYQLAGLGSIIIGCLGYVATIFFLLAGFTSKLDHGNDNNFIQFALLGGMAHVAFLSAFTYCTKNKMKRFLLYGMGPQHEPEETTTPQVRFEKATEGLPAFLVKFTSSYFLTFDESLKLKDQKKLRNMKKKVTLAKTCQYKRNEPEQPVKLFSFKALSPLLPNILTKKFKSGKKEKCETIPLSDRVESSSNKHPIGMAINYAWEEQSPVDIKPKPQHFASEAKKNISKDAVDLDTPGNEHEKICFSANDIEYVKKIDAFESLSEVATPTQIPKEALNEKDDKSCIICFDKSADAVIMGCGHGGICYECALESWKKSQECFLCRAKIEKVLHVDANKIGKFNMTKVLSATKLVREEPINVNYNGNGGENFRSGLYLAMNHL